MSNESFSSNDGDTIDDQLAQEYVERADLVDKYDKGCEGQQVDAWENPDFELYKITDRYGFMHVDGMLPYDDDDERGKHLELKRENKWLKMLQDWPRYQDSVKFRRRLFKGVPDKLRSEVWRRLLELETNKQPHIYEQLKLRARLASRDLKQIDLDINRTYRNHLFFRRRYDLKQQSLFHVLAAYAIFNTQVGYCQGMSQVAALLLMYFDEEDAFWALHTLMCDEAHAMHGFFVPGFPKLLRFQHHHDRVLQKMLPKLKKHLDKMEIYATLYTTKWFFQCFLDRVPFTLALRLWDIFIMEGDVVLSGMAFTILRMHQKRLLKLNFEQTTEFLQVQLEQYFGYSNDTVVEQLRISMNDMRRTKLLEPLPPPEKNNEKPSKPFGEILKTPYDDLKRSMSAALTRKGFSSRSPSISASMPYTPIRHRSASPSRSAPSHGHMVTTTLAPPEPPVLAGKLALALDQQKRDERPHQQRVPLLPPTDKQRPKDMPLQNAYSATSNGQLSPKRSVRMAVSGADEGRNGDYLRQKDARYFSHEGDRDLVTANNSVGGEQNKAWIRHSESFYDNVPTLEQSYTDECLETDSGRNSYGGVTFTSHYSKTMETVTTTRSRQPATLIRSGPDNVTRIEVLDGDSSPYSSRSSVARAYRAPGKFPTSPYDQPPPKTPPRDYSPVRPTAVKIGSPSSSSTQSPRGVNTVV